jgi:hypothetical protein
LFWPWNIVPWPWEPNVVSLRDPDWTGAIVLLDGASTRRTHEVVVRPWVPAFVAVTTLRTTLFFVVLHFSICTYRDGIAKKYKTVGLKSTSFGVPLIFTECLARDWYLHF